MTDDDTTYIQREEEDDVTKRPGVIAEKEREDAFNAAYKWGNYTFEGISASRMDVWRSLCHKGGFPALDPCFDDTDLFYPRAKALIWLCIISTRELRELRAGGMDSLLDAFEKWVDANVPHNKEKDSLILGLRIFNQAYENRAEVAREGNNDMGKP